MRILLFITLSVLFSGVLSRNNAKSLTESHGQEVIEIGGALKGSNDLSMNPDLEEEPAAEDSEEVTSANTKRETLRNNQSKSGTKDNKLEDDEKKIEKELDEVYKDNGADYRDEADGSRKGNATGNKSKQAARQRSEFQFRPLSDKKQEIERFRTSADDVHCNKLSAKKLNQPDDGNSSDDDQKGNSVMRHTCNVWYTFAMLAVATTALHCQL